MKRNRTPSPEGATTRKARRKIIQPSSSSEEQEDARAPTKRARTEVSGGDLSSDDKDPVISRPTSLQTLGAPKVRRTGSNISNASSEIGDARSTSAIHRNRNLGYLQRMKDAFKTLKVYERRLEPVGNLMKSNLDLLFQAPPPDGQRYFPQLHRNNNSAAGYRKGEVVLGLAKDKTKVLRLIGPRDSQTEFPVPLDVPGVDVQNDNAVRVRITGLLANFMTLQHPGRPHPTTLHLVVQAAYRKITDSPPQVVVPRWTPVDGWNMTISFIKEETYKKEGKPYRKGAGIELSPLLPRLPKDVKLVHQSKNDFVDVGKDEKGQWVSLLPADYASSKVLKGTSFTKKQLQASEEFVRFVSWQVSGMVSTRKKITRVIQEFERTYIKKGKRQVPGATIFTVDVPTVIFGQPNVYTKVRIGKSTARELGLKNPDQAPAMLVKSLDVSWVLAGLDASARVQRETHDMLETVLTMAEMIDLANDQIREGELPPSQCFCDEQMKASAIHPCGKCGSDTNCTERVQDWAGIWACPRCIVADKDLPLFNTRLISSSMARQFKGEIVCLGKSANDEGEEAIFQDGVADVLSQLAGCERDEYRDKYRICKLKILATFSPTSPSIDAIHPFIQLTDGSLRNHAKGNLAITAVSLNTAKARHMVGILQEIGNYYCRMQRASETEKQQLRMDLEKRCRELHAIAVKQKFATKARLSQTITKAQCIATEQEWVSGKLSTGDGVRPADWMSRVDQSVPLRDQQFCGWDDGTRHDILNITKEILRRFPNASLDFADDEAPYFGFRGTMPSEWSWDLLWSFAHVRFNRMKINCNRYWTTVDSEMGIACELIYQACSDEAEYAEFLSLPIVACNRNPLNVSIGHKVHGKQMRTGWPKHPKKLAHRVASHNNILVETQFTNKFKLDYDQKKWYEKLREMVQEIQIPTEYYNPAAAAPVAPTFADEISHEVAFELYDEEPIVHQQISEQFLNGFDDNMDDDGADDVGNDGEGEGEGNAEGASVPGAENEDGSNHSRFSIILHELEARGFLDEIDAQGRLSSNDENVNKLLSKLDELKDKADEKSHSEFVRIDQDLEGYTFDAKMAHEHVDTGSADQSAHQTNDDLFRQNVEQLISVGYFEQAQSIQTIVDAVNSNLPPGVDYGSGPGSDGRRMLEVLEAEGVISFMIGLPK